MKPAPTETSQVLSASRPRSSTKAYYDKISHFYDLLSQHAEAPIRAAGLSLLNVRPGERALEIGFGTGHGIVALAKAVGPTGKVFGLDLSPRMVEMTQSRVNRAGLMTNVELRCGDAEKLPYDSGTMDAVFMSFALELFDTPEIPKVLGEIRRVLAPKGRLVVVGASKTPGITTAVFEWMHRHFPGVVDCRPIFVRRALEEAGFRIEKAIHKKMWISVELVLGINPP